jgi:Pyruvate/2-oxoacid:ferredoxin oxidoreductase delta subunit
MIASTSSFRVVVYEGPPAAPLAADLRRAILARLLDSGVSVTIVRDGGSNETDRDRRDNPIVLGQFGGDLPAEFGERAKDISGMSLEAILALIDDTRESAGSQGKGRWKPWFPVIDFKRCTNCMQCLSFCLFDVYGVTGDGRIQVQNESNCKTDCPACSRVCPEVAIMFPKYKAGPINGDAVSADDVRREAMKVDISALLGGDIYSMLRDRSAKAKSRFSKERDDERALRERQRCLEKLKGTAGFEVPPELLASLPSFDQIQAKAQEARERAAQALQIRASIPPAPNASPTIENAGGA